MNEFEHFFELSMLYVSTDVISLQQLGLTNTNELMEAIICELLINGNQEVKL